LVIEVLIKLSTLALKSW